LDEFAPRLVYGLIAGTTTTILVSKLMYDSPLGNRLIFINENLIDDQNSDGDENVADKTDYGDIMMIVMMSMMVMKMLMIMVILMMIVMTMAMIQITHGGINGEMG